ncbi:MAG: hypothetical protein LPH21_15920 [Shewanella sp.]|nr:hypothetical protein [Shewanella sp.]
MRLSVTGPECPVFFDRQKQREQLGVDVEAFLRSGGVIRQLSPGKAQGLNGLNRKRLEVVWGVRLEV